MDTSMNEYPVEKIEKPPHGNTKTGLPFHRLRVGESFRIPPEEYGRTNSARAHYQKKMRAKGKNVKFSSRSIRDENKSIVGYIFTRDR